MSKFNQKIELGDTVRIRFPAEIRGSLSPSFTVVGLKTISQPNSTPYWVLESEHEGELLVIDFNVVFEVMN
jgi:hypothetical protein